MIRAEDTLIKELIEKRRDLHRHPEIAFEEFRTTKQLTRWLEEAGIPILPLGLETGVVAEIKGEKPGSTIAIRSDIDALPIQEIANVPFQSEINGKMHACGHDYHAASVLGAAILLNQNKDKLEGNVRFIFQPAEEITEGAKWICDKGALEGITAIFGMHNKPELPVGTVGIKNGPLMASVDQFKVTFKGIGGHAGMPHHTIDPIVMASQYVLSVQTIIARKIDLFQNAVVSITRIQGGTAWNVISDSVVLEGTVRTFQTEAKEIIQKQMKRLALTTAEGYGGDVEIEWKDKMPTVNNDAQFEEVIRTTVNALGYTSVLAEPTAGGEDFAFYQQHVPGYFVWMGTNGTEQWHHPAFTVDEDAIKVASEFFANLAVRVLIAEQEKKKGTRII